MSSFSSAFKTLRVNPSYLVKPAIFAVISRLFSIVVYLMVFYSLNFTSISIIDIATIYCIIVTVETVTAGSP